VGQEILAGVVYQAQISTVAKYGIQRQRMTKIYPLDQDSESKLFEFQLMEICVLYQADCCGGRISIHQTSQRVNGFWKIKRVVIKLPAVHGSLQPADGKTKRGEMSETRL
jgi:hypothetical protein